MKVLYLTNIPSPYRVAYFNELGKKCELTVLFEKKGYADRDKSWMEFQFNNFTGVFLSGIEIGAYEKLSFGFLKYLKKGCYDYIIVTNMSTITGVLAVHWMKANHISYCIEGDGGFAGNGIGFKEKLKKNMISSAELCFSTSKAHDEYYLRYGALKEKIQRYPFSSLIASDIIPTPLNESEKTKIKQELGIKESRMIISVGSFIPRKGMDLLIKATSDLSSDWGVYIIGGTPSAEYLELKERYHSDNLHFVDFIKTERLKQYFKAADLFVLATREDIWGLVINEAMAYALPVITTDRCIAGLELVENGKNGFIVKTDDIVDLRKKINYFINSEKLIQTCAESALEKVRAYTIEKMSERHLEIFKENSRHIERK